MRTVNIYNILYKLFLQFVGTLITNDIMAFSFYLLLLLESKKKEHDESLQNLGLLKKQ